MVLLLFGVYLSKDIHGDLNGRMTAVLKGCASGVIQDKISHPKSVVEFKTINEDIYTFDLA